MAVTVTPQADPISSLGMFHDTGMNATANANVRPGATKLHMIEVDNSANGSVSYLKIYDDLNPVVGTTDPDMILPITASGRRIYVFTEDDAIGLSITNGISYACVTAGGTAGTSNPGSTVTGNGLADA